MESAKYIQPAFTQETRNIRNEFEEMIAIYSTDLWNYCRYITGSQWDGEDLYQDTVIKSFGLLPERWGDVTNKKSYLFRMATNGWLDQCRKNNREIGMLEEAEETEVAFNERLELEEVLSQLAVHLTPKQAAAFILFDVFKFSAEEIAGIVHSTTGGVYSSIQRARKKINATDFSNPNHKELSSEQNETITAYLKAFNQGDLESLLELFSDQAQNEAYLGFNEFSKREMRNGSMKFGLPGFKGESIILWGKPVIMILTNDEVPLLHDIQCQEVENSKIVHHKSYFFRKELMFAAGKELGVEVQLEKGPVDWTKGFIE